MIKTLILWLFLLISILTFSAQKIIATQQIEGFSTSKQQREPKGNIFFFATLLYFPFLLFYFALTLF
jgi:hypothetical protein